MATVDIDRVSVAFGDAQVLDDVSLALPAGAVALLDPALSSADTLAGRPLSSFATGSVTLVLVLIVALYGLVFFPKQLLRLFELFARRVSPSVEERGRRVLETFIRGLSVLSSPGRFAAVFGWTLAHWLLNALGFWLAFKAVGISAPFSAALFLQAFIALGTGSTIAIVMVIILGFMLGAYGAVGVQMSYFPELFGSRYRYAGVTLGREFSSVVGGGIAPLVSAALLTSFHKSWVPVAIYMTGMSLISFVAALFAPETLNRDLTLEHDA